MTSARSVERGRWKFVTSASTRRNSKPGVTKRSVLPLRGAPRASVSSTRTVVVPTATTRDAAAIRSHAAGSTAYRSPWRTWSSRSSTASGRNDARVVHHHERVPDLVGQLGEGPVANGSRRPLVDEQARLVPPRRGVLCDQLGRELVLERGRLHPTRKLPLPHMDEGVLERARRRLAGAAEGRTDPAAGEAALGRAGAG